jgi:hypothetical protein
MQNQPLTPDEIDKAAAVVRELMEHEAELLNHRMGWLVQTQGLLFASLAFAWDKSAPLAFLLAGLGIATAISLGWATALVSLASKSIYKWWTENVPAEERERRLVVGLWGPSRGVMRMLRPWRALPLIFVIAWIGVIILRALS